MILYGVSMNTRISLLKDLLKNTEKYNITRLVYYEVTNDVSAAIQREKTN